MKAKFKAFYSYKAMDHTSQLTLESAGFHTFFSTASPALAPKVVSVDKWCKKQQFARFVRTVDVAATKSNRKGVAQPPSVFWVLKLSGPSAYPLLSLSANSSSTLCIGFADSGTLFSVGAFPMDLLTMALELVLAGKAIVAAVFATDLRAWELSLRIQAVF